MADANPIGLQTQQVAEPAAVAVPGNPSKEATSADVDVEATPVPTATANGPDPDYPLPTDEERKTLRKVPDSISFIAYGICAVEVAERASFYGAKTVFSNYMQFPLPKGGDGTGAVAKDRPNDHAGALNQGLQFATALGLLFTFLTYVIPIFGAWLADTKLGRFKAIVWGVLIGGLAHVIMIGGAAPSVLAAGNGVAPFIISFITLALGAGIFKPCVCPLLIDQYTRQREYVKTTKTGEKVIVDPEVTIARIMLVFYACVNIGAFFTIATTYAEKYLGFWIAFLLPGIVYFALPLLLWWMYKRVVKKPPMGSELTDFFKITFMAVKRNKGNVFAKNFWDKAKPSVLRNEGIEVSWSERLVLDVRRTLEACVIFLYYPIYQINDGGIGAVLSNQGAAMTTKGAPNDLLGNFNPIVIIAMAPVLSHVIYPWLDKHHIRFKRLDRITFGFLLAATSGIFGAAVQYRVYETSPCGYNASTCDGVSPISIWWQLPNVILGAISELFAMTEGYSMAYARAPPHLKSVVMSLFLFMTALSSALAEVLIPAVVDPHLIWVWAGPAIALYAQTAIFYWRHRHVNEDEFMTYESESDADTVITDEKAKEKEG